MLIELGLSGLRPGYEWRIAVGTNGLRSLYVHNHCCERYRSVVDAYRACTLAAISLGFEFDAYGFVTNWYSVPGAGEWQRFIVSSRTQSSRHTRREE